MSFKQPFHQIHLSNPSAFDLVRSKVAKRQFVIEQRYHKSLHIWLELQLVQITKDRSERCLSACCFICCLTLNRGCWRSSVILFLFSRQTFKSEIAQESVPTMPKCLGPWPYNSSKGVLLRAEWKLVLYQGRGDSLKKTGGGGCEDYIINIEK